MKTNWLPSSVVIYVFARVAEARGMTHHRDMQEASHAPAYTSHPYLSLQNPQAKQFTVALATQGFKTKKVYSQNHLLDSENTFCSLTAFETSSPQALGLFHLLIYHWLPWTTCPQHRQLQGNWLSTHIFWDKWRMAPNICEPQSMPPKSQHSPVLGQNWQKIISKSRRRTSLSMSTGQRSGNDWYSSDSVQSIPRENGGCLETCVHVRRYLWLSQLCQMPLIPCGYRLCSTSSRPQDTSTENDSVQGAAMLSETNF